MLGPAADAAEPPPPPPRPHPQQPPGEAPTSGQRHATHARRASGSPPCSNGLSAAARDEHCPMPGDLMATLERERERLQQAKAAGIELKSENVNIGDGL